MKADALAKLALRVLDTQAEYFRSRNAGILRQSKALESALRKACVETIEECKKTGLFDGMPPDAQPTGEADPF